MKTRFTVELDNVLSRFIATASEAKMNEAFESARFDVYRNSKYPLLELFVDDFSDIAASSSFTIYLESLKPSIIAAPIVKERGVKRAGDHEPEQIALAA